MVVTRQGVRVSSPAKTNSDQSTDVPATPSTGRRTRSAAKQADSPTHHALVETSSHLKKSKSGGPASPPTSSVKRCTRASRLHSPEQPCTPVDSTHEGDVSDLESCCSALSDVEPPMTRTRVRRRLRPGVSHEDEDISEVESCSSAVSSSKAGQISRRSTRRKTTPEPSDPACVGAEDVKVDQVLETSISQRVTRSQKRTANKGKTEDSEVSDVDSCTSSISGSGISKSTTRRAVKSRRQSHQIPLNLDKASKRSSSPVPTGRQTRAARAKASVTVDVSESPSCDSEGFESGPTYSITTRRRGMVQSAGPKALDLHSELTDGHSPLGHGTPCSSRTGSGNSSRGASASRHPVKELCIVLDKAGEQTEEDSTLNDSRLESTVTAEDTECTLLEETQSQTLEEKDLSSNEADTKRVVNDEPAVMAKDQQEEPSSAENKDGDTSGMEMIQEMIQSSKLLKPCQSVTVTICEKASKITEERGHAMEVADVEPHTSQGDRAEKNENAAVEAHPCVEEKMEVSTLNRDVQQVVGSIQAQVESIQVTRSQQHEIIVDSDSEQQPRDVIVQKTKVISLLESSDDEDEEEEREFSLEEEEQDDREGGGLSKKLEGAAASASIEGLFMIDTRPGQEADEHYYKEKLTEQPEEARNKQAEKEEQDEEFVDEEADDDDDKDTEMLFWSRNPKLKEMSSRIDPGIRVKELGGLYINFDGSKSKPVSSSLQKLKEKKIQDEVMKKSVIGPDFEKMDAVPPYSESKKALKLKHRVEKEQSTGDGWFNMKAPEISQELKRDLQVLKMRGSMDPKRFYKKNDRDGFPKYFQVGTVVDNAVDFHHSRIPKKERKRTMVEELLADAEFRHDNKKKFQHIVAEKAAKGAGKRNKKKNKFHKK